MLKVFALLGLFLAPAMASMEVYSSDFQEPAPPLIASDFSANFMQHKWNNISMSHVTSGIIYASATNMKTRIDNTHDGVIQISLFDYKNFTKAEGYLNKNYVLQDLIKGPQCEFSRLPVPAYPMFTKTLLQDAGAVFAGWTQDEMYGALESWSLFYEGIPVTVFIDTKKRFVRYDFWLPQYRTFTTTRFYNIKAIVQNATLFELPC